MTNNTEVHTTRSGMVKTITYNHADKLLTLEFSSGGSYEYEDVPKEVFEGLIGAESAGKYFHANIKGKYESKKV